MCNKYTYFLKIIFYFVRSINIFRFFSLLFNRKSVGGVKKKKNIPTLYFLYVRLQVEQDSLW